jgi:hypothetical protein
MLSENKLSKYLLYAAGEIFLVMIGILLALEVNDWNEQRKAANNEQEILISLRSDLNENINELGDILDLLQFSRDFGDKMIEALKNESLEPDSFCVWVDQFRRNPLFNDANTTYLMLSSSGEGLITNDSLRVLITMMYEREFDNVHQREALEWDKYHTYKEALNESFRVGTSHWIEGYGIESSVNTPVDYALLRTLHEFNNALVDLNNFKKIRIRWLKQSIDKLEDLIERIDKEIKHNR